MTLMTYRSVIVQSIEVLCIRLIVSILRIKVSNNQRGRGLLNHKVTLESV